MILLLINTVVLCAVLVATSNVRRRQSEVEKVTQLRARVLVRSFLKRHSTFASSHHAASYHLHNIFCTYSDDHVILHAMCKIAGCNCALSAQLIMDGVAPTNDLLLPISLLENDGRYIVLYLFDERRTS